MIAAAVYARKSTEQRVEDESKSVTRQVENAIAFATSQGWTVDPEHIFVDDGVSGAEVGKLRGKMRLLELIRSGKPGFGAVVMQASDRLSRRDGDEALAELKSIARTGVAVWFYGDGSRFEYGSFATNTLGFLRAEFAAEFRRSIASKTAEAMRRKAEQGHVTGGRVFGYDNIRVNSHTERRINEVEAAIVRRIFAEYAEGAGLSTIAHRLNADAAPAPRAQQGRLAGWAPSSIREVLKRPLYRGQVVYGKTKKRDLEGSVRPSKRATGDWLTVDAPHLRIVSPELSAAVEDRFAGHSARALRTADGRLLGRPPRDVSPYLLTGLLRCAGCGGTMEVLSEPRRNGRRVHSYRCATARRKGAAVCGNRAGAPMNATDRAVLDSIADTVLHPATVERAIELATAELCRPDGGESRAAIEREFRAAEAAVARLTQAIAAGGDIPSLVDALASAEARRTALSGKLESVEDVRPAFDPVAVRSTLHGYLADWRGLLMGRVEQAQQILKRLVVGRLTMTPSDSGSWSFDGFGTMRPVLAGVIREVASPPGIEPGSQP